MKIGYARVSRLDQNLNLQIDALKNAGCDEILSDKVSGVREDRTGLRDAFRYIREGDTLVVYKLDRLARSMKQLIELIGEIEKRKAHFVSISENIDTNTPMGKFMFHLFGSFAEFERGLLIERTNAGLVAAKARGRSGGRKPLLDKKDVLRMVELYQTGAKVPEICKIFGMSRTTFYKYFEEA